MGNLCVFCYSDNKQKTFQSCEKIESFRLSYSNVNLNKIANPKNIRLILNDPTIFLSLFFKTLYEKKLNPKTVFHIKKIRGQLCIKSSQFNLFYMEEKIDLFRRIVSECLFSNQEINIFLVDNKGDLLVTKSFEKQPFPIDVDTSSFNRETRLDPYAFRHYIDPCLRYFLPSIGIDYECIDMIKPVHFYDLVSNRGVLNAYVFKMTIKYLFSDERNYFIPFCPIDKRPFFEDILYDWYLAKRECDFIIKSLDGATFLVHRFVLMAYGGSCFEQLSKKQSITMRFSKETVRSVIEALYLGPRHLEKMFNLGQPMNFDELLECTYTYQLELLFKQVVNLVIASSTKKNVDWIEYLVNRYPHDSFNQLLLSLNPSSQVGLPKSKK